jgi:hypothetical protein
MREIRLYGSEGGEVKAFPTPILVILSLRYKQCCLTTRNTILFFLFRFHLLRVTSQRQVVKSFTVTVQGKNGQAVSGLHSLGVKEDRKGRADTLYDLLQSYAVHDGFHRKL